MRNRRPKQSLFIFGFLSLLCLYALVLGMRAFLRAGEFQGRDRITIVLYGKTPLVISLGLTDAVSYIIPFSNDDKVRAVGGYGKYSIGSLGKLSKIEKDPDLLRRTFSSIISAHVTYVFIPSDETIYFDTQLNKTFSPSKTALLKAIISGRYETNADLVDRIFLFGTLLSRTKIDFLQLKSSFIDAETKDFSEEDFSDYYQGFFYEQSLRNERTEVKIEYSQSYQAAKTLSRILQGQGIRVVDISKIDGTPADCTVAVDERTMKQKKRLWVWNYTQYPESALFINKTFGCSLRPRQLDSVDQVVTLGSSLEQVWK